MKTFKKKISDRRRHEGGNKQKLQEDTNKEAKGIKTHNNKMQKYFVKFLQGYLSKPNYFSSFKIIHFKPFLFKKYMYLYI